MQDKRDELYNNLIKSGKVNEGQIGTIDQFKSSVKDEATAKKFHENLMGAGFSADEIGNSDVFYGAISSDFQQSKVAPVQAGTIQQPSQISQQSVQAATPSKKDVEIFGGIPYSEYQKLPGKDRLQVYSKWQGDKDREAQAKLRGSNNNQVESLYADVNKEMEALSASEKVEAPAGSGFIPASARGAAQRYGNAQNKEKQDRYTMLESAKDLLENSQEIIVEAGKRGDTNFFGGAGRGFRDKAFDLDTWAMGVTDLYKNKFIKNAAEKADKGEELTREEQRLLDAATINMATQALFSSDLGRGYKAGGVTAESLPFMLEMIANPAATAGKGVGNAILRYGVKKFGAKAAEKATGVVAKKLLGNVAKASTRVTGDVLAAGAMTATSGIARTAADAVSRNTGQVTYGIDEEGKAEYAGTEGGVSGVEAAYKAFAGNTIEGFSEMFGGYFGALGGVIGKTRPMQALKASKVGEAFSKINSSDWAKTVAEFEKKTNYNGTFGEYGEEVVGTVLNSIFTGDQSFGDLADVDQQIDTFLGVSLMGGFMSSVKALGYRTPKYEAEKSLRKAEKNIASYFGDDWVGIRSTLEEADVEDRTAYLSSVLSSEMNAGEKKAMFEYVSKLTTRDAIKAGDEKLAEEGVDLNDGIAQNKASVYNGYNEAAKKALKSLSIEVIEEIDQQIEGGVDGDQLHQYIADKGLPENQSDDLLDYSVAKQDFNDYINGVQTRIDSEKANARQQMESVSNPEMGATVRVKSAASETPIHVVGGKLVFDEQGFVDEKQSDEVVYYIDEAGERKMAASSMFESLIDSTPTEELIAQAEADVENGIIAQEDLELYPLEVGQSVYTPNGMPGEVIRFTAEGDPIVLSDTGEQVFKKEELVSGIRADEVGMKKGTESEVKVGENAGGIQNADEESDIIPAAVESLPEPELADAGSIVPMDEKGNLLYHRAPVDTTLESVRSYGLDDAETDEFVSAQKVDASKRLEKLQKGKPKVGTNLEKYQSDKKSWEESLLDAQSQLDYWDEVEAQVQATRVQPGDATAAAIASMGDAMNGSEFAAMTLGGGKLPLLFDDYKRETGFGNQDAKGMFGLFAAKANGGMSIEQAGEKLMEMDAANGTGFFDQADANAGRNAVLDVLSSSRTRGDLFGYIKENRERMAERERQAEYSAYEQWVNNEKHMSVVEYEADEEAFDARTKEFVVSYNFDEINGDIADDLIKEENDRRTEEPGVGSIPEGTAENIQGELNQGQRSGRIEQSEGSGTVEESERWRQGGSEESVISGADVVGSEQSDGGVEEELVFAAPEIKEGEHAIDYATRIVGAKELHDEQKKVETNPTEAQKEAGNYRMGHVKIGGHDVTIENPKGSIRRGIGSDGKAWETPMNNTYGYFRGTKGKDGDHIDTFLGDNLEPENIYVVDQVNEDGSFDEHKVMYGFDSADDARAAYLSNYESGWQGLGEITSVTRGVFDKWLGSKTKKRKPFAEYKVVRESIVPDSFADIQTEEPIVEEVRGEDVTQAQEPFYGAENKVVSSERYEELKKKLRSKLGQMNVGFDPELFALGSEMAAFHIEAGARKISDFANRMIADVGDGVRPYLKSFYEAARNFPGMESVAKEMDSYKKVTSFDVNAFDKVIQNTSVQHQTSMGSLFDEVDATNNIIQENNESNSNTVGNHDTMEFRGVSSSNAKGSIEGESRGTAEVNREQSGEGVSMETGSREERGERERSRRGVAEPAYAIVSAGESDRSTDDGGRDGGDTIHSTEGGGDRSEIKNTRNHIIERGSEVAPKGETAKIRANISAIKLAKKLHENGRVATSEQMHILQKYTGWGGLSSVFKEDNPHHQSLKDVLSDEEYDSARASTTTSFYTPASIVSSTWDMIEKLGFKGGVVLEPSAGIGHFFGLMPQSISVSSSLRGIELDCVSGLILKALYPDAKVDIGGFEEQRIANNSVDLVVSNVPFGAFKLHDKSDKDISSKFDIHDFFIAKSIRKLKPGGIGVFITTSSSLDRSAGLRSWVINDGNADFIDAIRLNSDTFKSTAGTEATADVIIIRKRDESGRSVHSKNMQDAVVVRQETYQQEIKPKYAYMSSTFEDKKAIMRINKHFADNPTRMAGVMKFGFEGGNEIRPTEQRCAPKNGLNQEKVIRDFIESLPADVYNTEAGVIKKETLSSDGTKEGGLTIIEGSPCTIEFGEVKKLDWNSNKVSGRSKNEVLSDYIDIRKAINELLSAENENTDNIEGLRGNLNKVYDRFVDRYGYLSNNKKILFLRDDVDFPSISAIENVKDVSKPMSRTKEYEITKSDIFSRRMISAQRELKANNVADAINLSLYKNGKVELPYIAKLIGKSEEEVRGELLSNKLGFINPSSGLIEDRNEYLSGNVREKLAIAEQSNENGEYSINIEELSRIIPNDIPIHLIKISLGSTWVPANVYDHFFKEAFDVDASIIKTSADKFSGNIEHVRTRKNEALGIGNDALGSELAFDAMNNTSTSIYRREYVDGKMVSIKDVVATAQAAAKQTELSELFESWCKKGGNPYSENMESIYNNTFNAVVEKKIDVSSFDSFPGAVTKKIPREHQKEGVLRSLERAVLLAHEVGTGKTITLISAAMEMRRLGLAKKPVIVVQRSTFDQFVREIKELYPSAKVLVPSAKDLTSAQRQQLFSKIAYNDWDIVVLYHSYLDAIPDSQERVNQYIDDQIQEKMDMLKEVSESNADNSKRMASQLKKDIERLEEKKVNVKQEEKTKANAKAHAERLMDRRTDNVMTFEQLGIDALLIDEAHAYKKLGFSTSLQNIKGIDTAASQRAQSLRLKSTYILENNQGRNVVFATGTPISNTMAEMWTFMRYLLSKSELQRLQMNNFDAFVNNFGSIEESSEFGTNGKFRVANRFSSFSNTPELLSVWKQVSHTVLTEEVSSLKEGVGTPRLESGKPIDVMIKQTAALKAVMRSIKNKLEEFENMPGAQKKENSHIPLVMFGLAKRAAIDVRLVDPNLPDDPNSKLNETVRRIVSDLDETKEYNGTVAVFCDSYQSSDKRFNVFGNIKQKLIDKGVPAEHIAIVNDYNTDDKRGKLFEQLNSGDVRVVMGTTEKLGVGVNMQERLHLLVHMDAPIRPSDYQQRNGRIARQGNKHLEMGKEIRILRIGVEQTLDVTGYQRLEIKKKFIDQIMKGDVSQRSIEESDMDGSDSNNFSQMMAQLSGSQSALAHSIEMNKLRKLKNAKTYHEQGQIHLSNEIKRNKSIISTTGQQIKKLEKDVEAIKSEFPSSEISTVKVGSKEVSVDEAPALLSKTLGKRIDAEVDALKKDFSRERSKISTLIYVNGVKMAIEVDIERAYNVEKKSTRVKKQITASFDGIPNSEMSVGATIENVIPVANQFISCKEIEDQIRKRRIGLEKAMRDNEAYEPKIGEVFPRQSELENTDNRVNELEAKMKEELAEIEAREAKEVIEEIDLSGSIESEELLYRESGGVDNQGELTDIKKSSIEFASNLGSRITFISRDNLPKGHEKAKGYFDTKTGLIHVCAENHQSVEDVERTILHEAISHKGLRDMFGVGFGDFLDDVFKNASDDIRTKIMNIASGHDGNHRVATEEYLAELAESGFKNEQDRSIWNKIKDSFIAMLRKIGIRIELSDADLRSILKKSYDNLVKIGGIEGLDNAFEEDGTPSDEMLFRDSEGENILRHVDEDRRSITQVIDAIRRINEIKKNELSERTWGTKIAEGLFDDAFKLKMLQDVVEAERGSALPGYMNPYQYITSIPKRNEYETERFNEQYMRPIYKEMRAMKDAGASEKGIYAYLYAKSGLERNEKMRTKAMMEYIDAIDDADIRSTLLSESSGLTIDEMYFSHENAEKKKMSLLARDYSGLTELREILFDEDSNKGEDRIQEWVDEFENKYEIDNLWISINLATKATLENEFRAGKIDKATKKKIEGMYDYYLPLRKWEGEQAGDVWEYANGDQKEGIGSVVKKAFGRKSLAGNPIVNIGLMGQQSIHSGNRNELKQMFLSMARNNPNEAYAVSPLWIKNIGTEGSENWVETAPEWDDNPDVFAENVERFDEEMAALQKEGRAKQKYTRGSVGMPITKMEANEHQIVVSEAGRRYVVYVNSDPAIARAINGIGGKAYSVQDGKALSNDFVQKIIRGNGMIMRTMGQSFTTWNPMFVLANGQRDIMNALLVASVKEGKEYAGEMAKNMFSPSVHGAIMRAVLGKSDMNNPIDKLFAEYESNGGETGFSELFKDSDFERQIKKELSKKKINPMDVIYLYLNNVEKLNRWAENVSRFSTYKASRDSGRDVYRSVYDAKEITVNFNRKGTGACGGNFLRLIYIFSGAGLQAAYQIGRLSINRKTRKKTAVLMTSVAVAGYLIPLMNNVLLGGDGDDIEDGYDFKPEYERKSNIMTRIGKGQFAKLSIPQELRPFWNIGETLYQLTRGNIDTWEASVGITKGFAGVMPFDPFGSSGLVPTVLQPIDQVRNNENFFGGKIYKEETRYNKHLPQWRRSFRNTSPIAVGLSKWLNDATGGDEATQGVIDINPGGMESLVEGYFGGAVKFINNMAKTTKGVVKAIDGDSSFLETRNIPFVSSFYTDSSNPISKEVERLYWDCINLSERLGAKEREYRKLMDEHPEKASYYQAKFMELKESKDYERKKVIDGYSSTISNMAELVNRDILDGKSKTVVLKQIKDLKKNMLNEINKIK